VDFLAEHQLYIVMIIVLGIWFGLFAYLVRLENRIKKLERHSTGS
jgi:CcmD family protein